MKLEFSLNDIDPLWIDGSLPLRSKINNRVKVELTGESDSFFPSVLPLGDLLCMEQLSPLQHAITLILTYPHSATSAPEVKRDNGWWIYGQIRIPLPSEAIAQIREINGAGYGYELALKNVQLVSKTKPSH
jgi:hypothetical protein